MTLARSVLAAHPAWRLRAMLFQGFETDGKNAMPAATFRAALTHFVASVRAELCAAELPIVFGELPAGFVDAYPERIAIRDEVLQAPSRLPYTAVASSRSPSVADDDGLHYSTAGLLAIGEPLRRRPREGRGERAFLRAPLGPSRNRVNQLILTVLGEIRIPYAFHTRSIRNGSP